MDNVPPAISASAPSPPDHVPAAMVRNHEIVPGDRIATHGGGGVYGYDTLPMRWNKELAE